MNASFARLESLSVRLNEVSDALSDAIERADKKLASLRLGVTGFTEAFEVQQTSDGPYTYCLAYTKTDEGNWGLVIWMCDSENAVKEETPLLQAPRERRVKALEKLPELIVQLELKAAEEIRLVDNALNVAKEV